MLRKFQPLALIVGLCVLGATARPASQPIFVHLDPGGPANLTETVPVQFVFVGLEPTLVPETRFLAGLPATYDPLVRSRLWYGVKEPLGIHYALDYRVTYADAQFENAFFAALTKLAKPAPRTLFQDTYNGQRKNVLDVGQNYFIDAASVEKWLVDHAPRGVDTARNTVFFINWWGRPDFRFHVYTKFGEADPDTGYDFGVNRHSRKIVAWGGTTPDDEETGLGGRQERRVWFYDLSAGPESWGGSYDVDNHDIDGDGMADYRLPVAWEYLTPGGYRAASALAGDLALVARYVAINLLFVPSPLYPPYLTPARQPSDINLDLNTYEGMPGVDASEMYQTPDLLVRELSDVHRVPYNVDLQDVPFTGQALDCYVKWVTGAKCDPSRPQYHAFANLFLYNALNIRSMWNGGAEYEGMFFNYATTDRLAAGLLGFADDNWIDGTQSFTFNFLSPGVVAAGYGLTTTQIHEYGHHFGMSHPHDGYDSERGIDYGPSGSFFFAWLGDEVNSIMSYIDLNWDYSQFDRDNANRYQAAAYIINANAIAGDILESTNAAAASADLANADAQIGNAKTAIEQHDYRGAFDFAKAAYESVRSGAAKAGVAVVASENGWYVQPPLSQSRSRVARPYSYIDRLDAGSQRAKP